MCYNGLILIISLSKIAGSIEKEGVDIMDYITTYTGRNFNPIEPDPNEISIEDISHAQSLMCRANGHCLFFYSVAQHSINCYLEAKARGYSERVQLGCLLHDGSEAYMADIVRPYKKHLTQYLKFEEILQSAIWARFGLDDLTEQEISDIFKIDDLVLYNEFNYTMKKNTVTKNEKHIGNLIMSEQRPKDMQILFLEIFESLYPKLSKE